MNIASLIQSFPCHVFIALITRRCHRGALR
uniref:Uncharacterized protein n=1 Tax=Anguilla anguilla TaxID=7936 RepID=A0A0E9V5G3_ANGAN